MALQDNTLEFINKEKVQDNVLTIAVMGVSIAFGLVGNVFSLLFHGIYSPRSANNAFITLLAVVDLITCTNSCGEIAEITFIVSFQNVIGCKTKQFLSGFLVVVSGLLMLILAVDRYRKVCAPFGWQFSIFYIKVLFPILIVLSAIIACPNLIIMDVVEMNIAGYNVTGFYCTISTDEEHAIWVVILEMYAIVYMLVQIVVSVVLYGLILRTIILNNRRIKQFKNADKSGSHKTIKENTSDTGINVIICDDLKAINQDSTTVKCAEKDTAMNGISNANANLSVTSNEGAGCSSIEKIESKSNMSKNRVVMRITVMMITLNAVSIICYVPYFVVHLADVSEELSAGIQIALRTYTMNNSLNPYIICIFNTSFRLFVSSLFCKQT